MRIAGLATAWALAVGLVGWTTSARGGEIAIDCAQQHQIIHGFGTCLKGWGDPAKDPVAKWQLTEDVAKLYVDDAGLAVVRIPMSQWALAGENPYKIKPTATAEMIADPTKITYKAFNWEGEGRSRGSVAYAVGWAKAMKARNPNLMVIGSVWSPPHWMKEKAAKGPGAKMEWSKFGANTCGGRLSPKFYTHYAHYLAEWSKGLKEVHGIDLYAVSIQNELSFYEPYDSCVYTPDEFAAVVKEVGRVFKAQGIKTKIMGPEDMTKFPDRQMSFVKAAMKDPAAAEALAIICSHGYADGIEVSLSGQDAGDLWRMMQKTCPGKEYWMTETGAGTGTWTPQEVSGKKGKQTQPGAMGMFGGMLHNALVYGNASLWTTWQFIDTKPEYGSGLVWATLEKVEPTKKFYVQKHYAKFIPPGSHRVEAGPDGQDKVLVSAYTNAQKKAITIVLQNHGDQAQEITLSIKGGPAAAKLSVYVTDEKRDCAKEADAPVKDGKCTIRLPGNTMMTVTSL